MPSPLPEVIDGNLRDVRAGTGGNTRSTMAASFRATTVRDRSVSHVYEPICAESRAAGAESSIATPSADPGFAPMVAQLRRSLADDKNPAKSNATATWVRGYDPRTQLVMAQAGYLEDSDVPAEARSS
jgi:hypothetical protein